MKIKSLITALSAGMLFASASAFADLNAKSNIINQNLSKRPYQHAPVESKKDNFEGATLISDDVEKDQKYNSMRLHMLDRRPYSEKNAN